MSVLITKTRIPVRTSNLVARSRLLLGLDELLQPGYRLAVISAPVGFGKTSVLTQWIQTVPKSFGVAWLSVDEGDNALVRFFAYVVAALQVVDPLVCENFSAQWEVHPKLTVDEIVTYLINQVAASAQNMILIIDDVHVITSPEINRAIEMLVNYLPDNLRLVLAGRVDPMLPLARLRVRGQLVEIRTADLRFNITETTSFLEQCGGVRGQTDRLAHILNESTEGWAAGLQMMTIAVRAEMHSGGGQPEEVLAQFVSELSGSHRFILDYLLDEVLTHEEPRVREFLLRTCILERFNADLCAALCFEEVSLQNAQWMLEQLERANLFIIPLDNQREWYRYHHLFADVLRKQLLHVYPGLAADLHRRAADWFERQNMLDEAIAHAYCSGDMLLLSSLIEKYALQVILRGQITTAGRWLDYLPAEVLMTSPRLCLDRAWALTFTSQTEAAIPYLERAEALFENKSDWIAGIESEILGLQSYRENTYGRADEAIRLAQLALHNCPAENTFLQCSNHLFLAGGLARAGKLDEALAEYKMVGSLGQNQQNMIGLALLEADFLHYIAMHLNARGQVSRAKGILRKAIEDFTIRSKGHIPAAALFLYVALGKILFLENDLVGAEQTLQQAMQIDPISMSVAAFDGWEALWWVKVSQGDFPAARAILLHLEKATRSCDEKVIRTVVWTGALQDLLEGQIDRAAERLNQLGLSGDVSSLLDCVTDSELMSWRCNEFFTFARVLAAKQQFADSLKVLGRMEQAAEAIHVDWIRYRVWITQAIVCRQMGHLEKALAILAKLLENTSKMEGNPARIYLSAGEAACSLLREALQRGVQQEHVAKLLAAFSPQAQPTVVPGLAEALSEREIEVLRLMAQGLKNQQIAEQLVVSLNTVRYHSKNIFGKLGVENRTAAVRCARELGLLD